MRTRQLSDLIADTRKRGDWVSATAASGFGDTDITELLNQGWAELYGKICRSGSNYYLKRPPVSLTTISGQDTYAFNTNGMSDFFIMKGVDVMIQGSRFQGCEQFQWERRNDFQDTDWAWPGRVMFDVNGSGANASITFIPTPGGGFPVRLWYYPAAVRMVANSDTIDGVNGWEIYVVDWATKRLAEQEENYELAAKVDAELMRLEARIMMEMSARVMQTTSVRIVRGRKAFWPWGRT